VLVIIAAMAALAIKRYFIPVSSLLDEMSLAAVR
jgi:hypothetical protein